MTFHSLVLSLSLFLCFSCTFNNEEEYFEPVKTDTIPQVTCFTANLTYDSLSYIFRGICYSCHSSDFTYRSGIQFDNYQATKSAINTGKLLPAIKHEGNYKMPYQQAKLSDCEIERIEAWIKDGMPEN